jgi:hypothetical protein
MTFKTSAVKQMSESIMDDIKITYEGLVKAFLNSEEVNKQINERIARIELIEDEANKMLNTIDTDILESAEITLNGISCSFNKEFGCFEYDNKEERAKDFVQSEYRLYTSYYKMSYISSRVYAIVASLDDSMDFDGVKEKVFASINLDEIIRNKSI